MAHGSKKFIKDFKGKMKRSRHRTKEDYYGELRWWSPSHYPWRKKINNNCPECQLLIKNVEEEERCKREIYDRIRKEWEGMYGNRYIFLVPETKEYLYYQDFLRDHPLYPGPLWRYEDKNYLCPKHQKWEQKREEMWKNHLPGEKRGAKYAVRVERRKNRQKMRQLMRNGEYDLPITKRGWLY